MTTKTKEISSITREVLRNSPRTASIETSSQFAKSEPDSGRLSFSVITGRNKRGDKVRQLVNNSAFLDERDLVYIDEALLLPFEEETPFMNDLKAKGLVVSKSEPGKDRTGFASISMTSPAKMAIEYSKPTTRAVLDYKHGSVGIPYFYHEFFLNKEKMERAAYLGVNLVSELTSACKYQIDQKIEDFAWGIDSWAEEESGLSKIYGASNHPNRMGYTIPVSWTGAATPEQIRTDVLNMIKQFRDAKYKGKLMLYVSEDMWVKLQQKTVTTQYESPTVLEELNKLAQIEGVRTTQHLTGSQVLMIAMNRRNLVYRITMPFFMKEYPDIGYGFMFRIITRSTIMMKTDYNDLTLTLFGSV